MISTSSEDCFAGAVQDFLICTTVHKAQDVGVANGDLYVRVSVDKMHKSTKTFPKSENPFFNEYQGQYFVFELKLTLNELQRLTILYELKKRFTCKKNATIGELLVDLHTVWNQPNHSYFKKWGRLETPIASHGTPQLEAKGYLQIDLTIVSQSTNINKILPTTEDHDNLSINKWHTDRDYDDIESNLLQNFDSNIHGNIRYFVCFYRGYFVRKSDYLIQVSFAGLHVFLASTTIFVLFLKYRFHPFKGKTQIVKSTSHPVWNEEISFAWTYPSLAQLFFIQIFMHEHFQWKCIAECEIHFNEIAFKEKPALGPTYMHLYDTVNPLQYIGRLLLEIRSEMLEEKAEHILSKRIIHGLDETRFWLSEPMKVEFLPLYGDVIHVSANTCKLGMRIAENTSNYVECALNMSLYKLKLPLNVRFFRQSSEYKSCIIRTRMPDCRGKYESDFFMQELVDYIKAEIETFRIFQLKYINQYHMHAKCLKLIITGILNMIHEGIENQRLNYNLPSEHTTWDVNRRLYLLDYFAKLPHELKQCRQKLKVSYEDRLESILDESLRDLVKHTVQINTLLTMTRLQDDWPELILVLNTGSKEVGFCRLNAKHFLDMHKQRSSNQCWRIKNFVFKDPQCHHTCLQCGCVVANVLGCLAIVNESEETDFLNHISADWKQVEPMVWAPSIVATHFKCHLFIHQAKVRPGTNKSGLSDIVLRIVTTEKLGETQVAHSTLAPIWNVVITLTGLTLPGSIDWYLQQPPHVIVEMFDANKFTAPNYIGCSLLTPSVISSERADEAACENGCALPITHCDIKSKIHDIKQKYRRLKNATPPPLKWVPIAKKGTVRADVLMSAEFVETFGETDSAVDIHVPNVVMGIPSAIRPNTINYVLEVIFVGLRNITKMSNSVAGKRRIKIMMADLVLSSGLSTSRILNSINFLVSYASGVVSLPDQQEYWPAIIATDVTISGNKHEHIAGAALIPNFKCFMQKQKFFKCLPTNTKDNDISERSNPLTMEEGDTELDEGYSIVKEPTQLHSWVSQARAMLGLRVHKRARLRLKNIPKTSDTTELLLERDFSWWTKFYNSMYPDTSGVSDTYKHCLTIYSSELEKQPEFSSLQDWAIPIEMIHGVRFKHNGHPKEEVYATLKLQLKFTPCQCAGSGMGDGDILRPLAAALNPKYQALVQSLGDLCKIFVRVYIVQGVQLRPRDRYTAADCFVCITLGSKLISDRAHYLPNQSNPIFGKYFELECLLPREHILEISVFDRDRFRDNIIGSTHIDLEDRWRTKHRATVGIANEFTRNGYNHWRDAYTPLEILNDLCQKQEISAPHFYGKVVEVDNVLFSDDTIISKHEDLQERLALTVLKNLDQLPSFGYNLVPEHVETRSLYREDCPGIEQGKLQLWLDLFEANVFIPTPIDITPSPPLYFEVRVIILRLQGIQMHDVNIFGKVMSDIYVIGWCEDADKYQTTDVHYRSFAGEANFNWRMIFPIQYSPSEDMMVVRRKSGFREEFEIKKPPKICLQVWDKDFFSPDDFLAEIELNISNMLEPYPTPYNCTELFSRKRKYINLFGRKRVRGWFPLMLSPKLRESDNPLKLGGNIELELEVRTQEEASNHPVGLGHDPPNSLPPPIRKDTSFNPLTHPLKSMTKILWPAVRKYVLIFVLVLAICGALIIFFSNLPYHIVNAFTY